MKLTKLFIAITIFSVVLFYACKDKKTDPPALDCSSKAIVVTATITSSAKCSNTGKLEVAASGSSDFTFQLNTGAFQADPNFNNLTAGTYNITAKDKDGCTKTVSFIVPENAKKGTTYAPVASIIASKCQGAACHSTGQDGAPINNMNTDCKIVLLGESIRIKAVDEGMGSLSTTDKNKITAWINAGGKLTD